MSVTPGQSLRRFPAQLAADFGTSRLPYSSTFGGKKGDEIPETVLQRRSAGPIISSDILLPRLLAPEFPQKEARMSRCNPFTWRLVAGWLAVLLIELQAASAQTSTHFPSVASDPTQSAPQVQTAPQPQPTPEELGDTFMLHKRYQAAIEAYKKSPKMTADLWNKMGIAYQMMFDLEDASDCYKKSLKLNPRKAQVLNNLGTVEYALKDYKSAERYYRKALKIDPRSALIYKNLGTNLLTQRKFQKGWDAYKRALALDPTIFENTASPRALNPASLEERGAMNYYMAKGCVQAGHPDCAVDYLRKALNEGFTNPSKVAADIEFSTLRGNPEFDELIEAHKGQ